MGRGGESSRCNKCLSGENKCQVCHLSSHLAPTCPFLYTKCKIVKCTGIRKLLVSGTVKNPGRMFLKCQYSTCGNFQWLDDAISESMGTTGSSSTLKQHRSVGCFGCGERDHWRNKCPWVGATYRVEGCSGVRDMKVSTWEGQEGDKYLGCTKCTDTQWFKEVKKLKEASKFDSPVGAQIVIQTTLEDLCSKLENFNVK
ncbi:zinc finger protein [Macleaya cordata]|uniref:Zinc finger protein n=1 Tax=Macleaya cordata TaxID=56857 RepID=A0A200QEP3_MACCD|nr:zinc finger protein [Macleaya cordata]